MIVSRIACIAGLALAASGAWAQTGDEANGAAAGRQLFLDYCASCHGTAAKGDGPVASSLKQPPRDLTQLTHRHGGTFPRPDVLLVVDGRDLVLAHGTREMPIWGRELKRGTLSYGEQKVEAKLNAIIDYLETLQQP
ncbi:MAG: cytochrome c [Gammaproteobacteria bacterium]|nr:cytochrome c [Gammaproteobacteria bacterium]MBI5615324.1 cytochrome c [Gammaproteobacteria bacterium]